MSKARRMKKSTQNDDSKTEVHVCVTCSTRGECENVFILTFEDTCFSKIFNSCMGFELSEDTEMKYICLDCINTIISFHTFKGTALKSYEDLCRKDEQIEICISKVIENNTENSDQIVFISIDDANMIESSEAESSNVNELEPDVKVELTEKIKQEYSDTPSNKPSDKPDVIVKDEVATPKEQENDNMWQCYYCNVTISHNDPAGIKKHQNRKCRTKKDSKIRQTVVGEEYLLFCCLCCEFKTKSEDEFRQHSLSHEGGDFFEVPPRSFGCSKCEYTSPRKGDVQRHVLSHLNQTEVQLIPCKECDFSSRYISSLRQHIRRKHKDGGERLVKTYNCADCSFQTAYKNSLVSHRLQHQSPVEQEVFYCYNCDFKTIYKTNLRAHMHLHKNPEELRKFVCEICGFSTNYLKRQRLHMLTHVVKKETKRRGKELTTRRKDAPLSPRSQAAERKKRRQEALIAEGVLFECDQCSYKTLNKYSFRDHQITHKPEDEVTYHYCDQCTYKARSKNSLNAHLITHKDPDKSKTHHCEYCAFRTAYPSVLRMHLLRHVPKKERTFSCEQCSFKTIYRVNFRAHLNLHKDPKDVFKFQCSLCQYKTACRSNLARHESRHGRKTIKREWNIKHV